MPEHVRERLRSLGFSLPLEYMERTSGRMRAFGGLYDYRDTDGVGRVYEVHRRSIHPAMRVCQEWGSLESGSVTGRHSSRSFPSGYPRASLFSPVI